MGILHFIIDNIVPFQNVMGTINKTISENEHGWFCSIIEANLNFLQLQQFNIWS